jgi:DNA (cytosine-5)-methyltransferase 1
MTRKILLDLFCGAGGAGAGYTRAGFAVVGVDIRPQPRYPFDFVQGDALAFCRMYGSRFDAIHASPPCQRYSVATWDRRRHPDLVGPTREVLAETSKPYIIENVPGAPLRGEVHVMCGSMFGLERAGLCIRRHRHFELNWSMTSPPCRHTDAKVVHVVGHGSISEYRRLGYHVGVDVWRELMGIDWMTRDELSQAIPPAYTQHIGHQLHEISTA